MTISTTKPVPSNLQLKDILIQEFSEVYTYKMFGIHGDKSILVGKSLIIGVQISKTDGEYTIQGTPPTLAGAFLCFLFSVVGISYFQTELTNLERETGSFLARRFS